jgi:hypothetical protein
MTRDHEDFGELSDILCAVLVAVGFLGLLALGFYLMLRWM